MQLCPLKFKNIPGPHNFVEVFHSALAHSLGIMGLNRWTFRNSKYEERGSAKDNCSSNSRDLVGLNFMLLCFDFRTPEINGGWADFQ